MNFGGGVKQGRFNTDTSDRLHPLSMMCDKNGDIGDRKKVDMGKCRATCSQDHQRVGGPHFATLLHPLLGIITNISKKESPSLGDAYLSVKSKQVIVFPL